jgi:hypothetical protein
MRREVRFALVYVLSLLLCLLAGPAQGDDAVVLPKGFSRIFVETRFYIPFENRYNSEGSSEPYAKPFNATLNNSVFPGLPPGFSLGQSVVSYQRQLTESYIQPAYGITDRLTFGVNIPYIWVENKIGASLNTAGANLGIAPNGAIAPLGIPGVRQANINDINNLLRTQFGLKPVATWSESGIGDIEAGFKYLYYRSESFRAAVTTGARFPTGQKDDEDSLVDAGLGSGTYALGIRLHQDYMVQKDGLGKRLGFPDPGDFFINTTFRYDWNLADTRQMRVCQGGGPFCLTKDNVHAKIGDVVQAEISARVGFLIPGLNLSPLYQYGYKFKDYYSGHNGLDYGSLNKDLDRNRQSEHIYVLQLTYTTIPLFIQKAFPLPLVAQISYRDRFAGAGGKPDARYIGFTLQAFF